MVFPDPSFIFCLMEASSLQYKRKDFLTFFWTSNCAKSIVTGGEVGSGVKGYVVPEGGLPWPEWIKT